MNIDIMKISYFMAVDVDMRAMKIFYSNNTSIRVMERFLIL